MLSRSGSASIGRPAAIAPRRGSSTPASLTSPAGTSSIERLRRFGEVRRFANGELLFETGKPRGMHVILSGHVMASQRDGLGHVTPILDSGPGQFYAEVGSLSGQPSLVDGVAVIAADFQSRLARHGVKKLEPQGQKFDPNLHEALFEIPDESVASGTVLQVMESGYTIGERVLRPAKVGVSRGGPKA